MRYFPAQSRHDSGVCACLVIASPPLGRTGALHLPVIDLAPRGEDGMVASVEEAESSAQHICVLSVGGNTLLESARPGVWVGTPIPTG